MPKPTNKQIEQRTIKCEFRVSNDSGKPTIFGYAAKFGVCSADMGGWVEVIAPGAFDATLVQNPNVRGLFNHNPDNILGTTASGTMRLKTDDVGLAYEIDPPDTQVARDLVVSMQRGDISASSFGFVCQDASWSYDEQSGMEVRTVKQADLYDASVVTYPAYPDATSGVRSLPSDMPIEVRSKLTARIAKRDDSGETCQCDCGQCQAGSCGLCSAEDCDDPLCLCQSSDEGNSLRSKAVLAEQDAIRRTRITLGFAELADQF
jgi:HK97 family phage prohead protease